MQCKNDCWDSAATFNTEPYSVLLIKYLEPELTIKPIKQCTNEPSSFDILMPNGNPSIDAQLMLRSLTGINPLQSL
jgi:hypothetical protein